jgi:hypothetical protein
MADFDLATITGALSQNMKDVVTRTVNTTSPTLRMFRMEQGEGKNCAWDVEGGGAIGENFTDGADVTNTGSDVPQIAKLDWGLYRSNFKITNLAAAAARSSRSPQGLVRPLARNMQNSARKLASTINGVAYSGAGTGTTIFGLAAGIRDDNTYAGIDRTQAANAGFRGKVIDPGALTDPTIALVRQDLGQIYDICGEKVDVALCNTAIWNKLAAQFTEVRRYNQDVFLGGRQVTLDASVDAIVIDGCMFVKDKDATANAILYLNSAYVSWEYLPPAIEILPDGAAMMQLEDTQGSLGMQVAVYPIARTGAAGKFTMEVQLQLKIEKPNACGKRVNVKDT